MVSAIVGDLTETVGEYYDYRNASDSDYSSHGTDDRQVSGVGQLYVYRGERGDASSSLRLAKRENGVPRCRWL
ncbi:hypothetical protein [Haloarcula marina]|uniref:hypothetical protein n=1 Tax=Haloarcula marina TaxID=2961574 RepID=UPI0020B6CF4B|nr:hypothetical protein [Halomicroarcula marina]